MKEMKEHNYHELYWKSTSGRAMGADHQRNRPLFIKMAKEWGFIQQIPCELPLYLCRVQGNIIDHVRKYRTESHGDVFVFSPYIFDSTDHETEEQARTRMMTALFRINPSLIAVYPPKYSFYHPNSFTFVLKGPRVDKQSSEDENDEIFS